MKTKLAALLKGIVVIGMAGVLLYLLFISDEAFCSRVAKIGMVLAGAIIAILRFYAKPSAIIYKKYENAYKDFLTGAFVHDKKNYKKLVLACYYWDKQQYDQAHRILDKLLESKCACARDYVVVYTVKAICYARAGRNEPLIEMYKKVLIYDQTNSVVWSDMGLTYLKMGKYKETYEAFSKAIEYDPENAMAYNNMSIYYMKTADPEKALEYALKASGLNPALHQPMSTAAISSMMLGNEENAEKYCEIYAKKGGDLKKLSAILDSISGNQM